MPGGVKSIIPTRSPGGHGPRGGKSLPSRPSDSKPHPHHGVKLWAEDERASRQAAALPNYHGEALAQHEIELAERMQTHGQKTDWIPRAQQDEETGKRPSSNDMTWHNHPGGPVQAEGKSTRATYPAIRRTIRDAVYAAQKNPLNEPGFRKSVFVVDVGPEVMPDKVWNQVGLYNRRNPDNRIDELWVLSENGTKFRRVTMEDRK